MIVRRATASVTPPTALRLEQEIICQESRYHRSSKRWDRSLKTCQIDMIFVEFFKNQNDEIHAKINPILDRLPFYTSKFLLKWINLKTNLLSPYSPWGFFAVQVLSRVCEISIFCLFLFLLVPSFVDLALYSSLLHEQNPASFAYQGSWKQRLINLILQGIG